MRTKKEPREAPDWRPERFEGFWKFYPRRDAKQRAMDAWDKLKPDDALIAIIGRALIRQKATDEWKRGVGIPYASTYLNERRWTDEVPASPAPPDEQEQEGFGWAQ